MYQNRLEHRVGRAYGFMCWAFRWFKVFWGVRRERSKLEGLKVLGVEALDFERGAFSGLRGRFEELERVLGGENLVGLFWILFMFRRLVLRGTRESFLITHFGHYSFKGSTASSRYSQPDFDHSGVQKRGAPYDDASFCLARKKDSPKSPAGWDSCVEAEWAFITLERHPGDIRLIDSPAKPRRDPTATTVFFKVGYIGFHAILEEGTF